MTDPEREISEADVCRWIDNMIDFWVEMKHEPVHLVDTTEDE